MNSHRGVRDTELKKEKERKRDREAVGQNGAPSLSLWSPLPLT
jgi:hypothetical protein